MKKGISFGKGLKLCFSPSPTGDIIFKTKKLAEEYVRNLFNEIGLCNSVKTKNVDYYNKIYNIILNHPNSESKLSNIIDFKIIKNKLNNNFFEINIIKQDNIIEDVSWRKCIYNKNINHDLNSALRYSINDQIYEYRNSVDISKCKLCDKPTNNKPHIDHIIEFKNLVIDFHNNNKLVIPTSFDNTIDGSNRKTFKKIDIEYENKWKEYHKQNAVLRLKSYGFET